MQTTLAFLVGAPGGGELLLIFVVILLMFGPKRLPEMARNIGKAMDFLRRTSQDFRDQMMRLDEEVPKIADLALKDTEVPIEHPVQDELPTGTGGAGSSDNPSQDYDNTGMEHEMTDSQTAVPETEPTKSKEENAGKIDSSPSGNMEDAPETGDSASNPKDGLAG